VSCCLTPSISFNFRYKKIKTYMAIYLHIYCYFHDISAKKNAQKKNRFAGRHLLTFESQKLNYFWKKSGAGFKIKNDPITNFVQHKLV
jgi:hypothetical protein